jgi:hypothetical protein
MKVVLALVFIGSKGKNLSTPNKIARAYTAITDRVERLKCTFREHHMQVSPTTGTGTSCEENDDTVDCVHPHVYTHH